MASSSLLLSACFGGGASPDVEAPKQNTVAVPPSLVGTWEATCKTERGTYKKYYRFSSNAAGKFGSDNPPAANLLDVSLTGQQVKFQEFGWRADTGAPVKIPFVGEMAPDGVRISGSFPTRRIACDLQRAGAPSTTPSAEARCGSDKFPLSEYIIRKNGALVKISAQDAIEIGKGNDICAATRAEVDALIRANAEGLRSLETKVSGDLLASAEAVVKSLKVLLEANQLAKSVTELNVSIDAFDSFLKTAVGILFKLNAGGFGDLLVKQAQSYARTKVVGDWAVVAKVLQYKIAGKSIPVASILAEGAVKSIASGIFVEPLRVRLHDVNTDLNDTARQAQARLLSELEKIDGEVKMLIVVTKVMSEYDTRLRAYGDRTD